jgi:hypothetical protein
MGSIIVSNHIKTSAVAAPPYLFVNNSNWKPDLTSHGYNADEDLSNDFGEIASLFLHLSQSFQDNFVGLHHYRRSFTNAREVKCTKHVAKLDFSDTEFLQEQQISNLDWELRLARFDIILSAKQSVKTFGISNLYEHFTKFHRAEHIEHADAIISRLDPSLPSFTDYLINMSAMSFYNMNISKRAVSAELSDFLQSVLLPMSMEVNPRGEHYQPRWAGFLSERLLDFWVEANHQKSKLSVDYAGVLIADKPGSKTIPRWVKDNNQMRKVFLGLKGKTFLTS